MLYVYDFISSHIPKIQVGPANLVHRRNWEVTEHAYVTEPVIRTPGIWTQVWGILGVVPFLNRYTMPHDEI